MEKSAVSIIIPVYNEEDYIERCLESVLNQSYKNLEIIIIDDHSNDASKEIIEKYTKCNNNFIYVKNSSTLGPAQTRNKGLQMASSPYILFLDCDDWIDLNCIEKAMNKFESDPEIDIVLWEIKTAFFQNKISSRYEYQFNNILSGKMALALLSHSLENEFFLSPLLGCKIFKKALIDHYDIHFPDTIYEDDMFTFLSFLYAKKIALISGSCLYYYQHPNSLTHHFNEKNISDFFDTFSELYTYVIDTDKESYYKYLSKSLNSMIDCMINTVTDPDLLKHYKSLIFHSFYKNVKIEEYYSYSFSITI